jgi:hypothetical protein
VPIPGVRPTKQRGLDSACDKCRYQYEGWSESPHQTSADSLRALEKTGRTHNRDGVEVKQQSESPKLVHGLQRTMGFFKASAVYVVKAINSTVTHVQVHTRIRNSELEKSGGVLVCGDLAPTALTTLVFSNLQQLPSCSCDSSADFPRVPSEYGLYRWCCRAVATVQPGGRHQWQPAAHNLNAHFQGSSCSSRSLSRWIFVMSTCGSVFTQGFAVCTVGGTVPHDSTTV